ncbi:MAG: amidohydrolase family protein [Acidobacteriota bacterium]|jgi:5-methylthioadenosine/S-adenosylhomocysteine deaminase|nr:amidohydrolase family protein [Bryobacteraceae bacterium CoA2 C42]MCA2965781.1 amidohydrolase family protein [Acidobacteriaceae bacterium]
MLRIFVSLLFVSTLGAADLVLTARYVVTMDGNRRIIENGAVAIEKDRIVAVGPAADVLKVHGAKPRLHRPDAILAPGLINTHTHAPMTLLRGIADDLRLQEWLERYIFPAEGRNVSPEFVRVGTDLAVLEMLLSGTTTYTDMYYFEEVIAEATRRAGMRAVLGQTIIGFPVPDAKTPVDALRRAEAFLKQFAGDPLITAAVAPHAIYTNSDETLQASRALANRYGAPLLIHLSETKKENEDTQKQRGLSPTQALEKLGVLTGRTVAAHGVWLDDNDIATLARRGVGVAHCPSSNMKLASGIAPVLKLLRLDVALGLGPDGPAGSNNDLNLFEEMDLAGKLAKVSANDPTALPAAQIFAMATIDGARVLGLQKEIGSLAVGKRADLITVAMTEAQAVPLFNVYSALVYALKGSDVQDVIVNGRMVVKQRQPQTLDRTRVLAAARAYADRISRSLAPAR